MMKKTIFFMLCLAPLGVQAEPFTGGEITDPTGVTLEGIEVTNMVIGKTVAGEQVPTLWISETNPEFSILSTADINVSGSLTIYDGHPLGLGVSTVTGHPTINMTFGSISAGDKLTIDDADAFTVNGSVDIANGFYVGEIPKGNEQEESTGASSMKMGAVTVSGGDTVLNVANVLSMAAFHNVGTGDTNIKADSIDITTGDIENDAGAGDMTITSAGAIDVAGSIYNRSENSMTVNATGAITVKDAIVNENGEMTINADSLTVNGGDDETNVSFVNKGDLTINVTGATILAHGFDISGMGVDNTFSLTTGSLSLGDGAGRWANVFHNKLSQFTLKVTQDDLNIVGAIVNGASSGNTPVQNAAANMNITAQAITVDSITNSGNKLTINAKELEGAGIVVGGGSGAIVGAANSDTDIASDAVLQAGDVSNSGTMSLNGTQVELATVVNKGGDLDITSLTNAIGSIKITGNVTNESGNTTINAKDIVIGGTLTNVDGMTIVDGSDTEGSDLQIGAIDVQGGIFDLTALVGGVNVDDTVKVTDGTMNIDSSTHSLAAGGSIDIDGNLSFEGADATAAGDVNVKVNASGAGAADVQTFVMSSGAAINIGGSVLATANGSHRAQIAADTITIKGNVTALGTGNKLVFGADDQQQLTVDGNMDATKGATIEIASDDANVGALNIDADSALVAHGTQITADTGSVKIGGGLRFNGAGQQPGEDSTPLVGMVISGTNSMTLKSDKAQVEIGGAIDLGAGNALTLTAENSAVMVGGDVLSAGTLNAGAQNITMGNIINTGTINFDATQKVQIGNLNANSGTVNISADGNIMPNVQMGGVNIASGAYVNIDSDYATNIVADGDVVVNGDVSQGDNKSGALNLLASDVKFSTESLKITGNYSADAGSAIFDVINAISIDGNINVAQNAELSLSGAKIGATNLDNNGTLILRGDDGIALKLIENQGSLTLDSGSGVTTVNTFTVGTLGTITLSGAGLTTTDENGVFATSNNVILRQNYNGALNDGDVNIASGNYTITTSEFNVAGIEQEMGTLVVNSNNINVADDIDALDVRFNKTESADAWINATIGGNVSGGVDFWGLKRLDIGGYYTFNNDSDLWAAIMPYDAAGTGNTSAQNYWSTIEVTGDNKVGEITNAENGAALITVGKQFVSNVSGVVNGSAASQPQVGITLFDTVDTGTAIWLLHAEEGINVADGFDKLRNLDVKFCNGDGSICINYADTLRPADEFNGTDSDLPIYISERDTDGDGVADSLYVVFDPAFGGPVEVFKIQPIVAEVPEHTVGEYVSAGALDNLIAGQLLNTKFYNNNPIELIPEIFKGTNLEVMAGELYDRMEYYNMTGEREPLARFSRLFQARELEQIAGNIALNEHTNFRDFEDRMFDEFIWNRNRSLKKAWLDVDYGFFRQDVSDGKRAHGNRFSVAGGFDWQNSETMILGLTARVSNSSSDNSDAVELGYLPNQSILGTADMTVDDLNIGLGGYMMKILGEKTRLYGNAFLDIHLLDTSRDQTFMDHIDGSGTAFSLISEWGLMHDWLNQYIVGNAYARVGYNFGFDLTEHAQGQDYMDMQSDGYLILTPGYSLMAQKRIYPSAWFQIRPYASIGVEYDVLGAPDNVKYKFALAHSYTKYDIDIDPLWANIGGGIEFLSANGLQVGIDYRYQYNDAIQLHNIKVTGSYRF